MGDYKISDIYQGGYSSLKPDYGNLFSSYRDELREKNQLNGFTGYRANMSTIGTTTDPRTAHIIQEVSTKLAPGNKVVELTLIQPQLLESIPNQHFEEVRRLSKLTGVDVTVHGPLVDASGMGQKGWDEMERQRNIRHMVLAMEQAYKINPEKPLPVTFHSTNALGGSVFSKDKEGKQVWEEAFVVNQETGQVQQVKRETKFYPGARPFQDKKTGEIKILPWDKGEEHDINSQLNAINNTEWSNALYQMEVSRESAERIMQDVNPIFRGLYIEVATGQRDPKTLSREEVEQINKIISAREFVDQASLSANSLFNKARKYATDEKSQKILKAISEQYSKELYLDNVKNEEDFKKSQLARLDPKTMSNALLNLSQGLKEVNPQVYKLADDFSVEKAGQSFGDVAWESWKKFGKNSPIVSIENPPAGQHALSRGEDLAKLVAKAREEFVKKATSDPKKKISESEAKKAAEQLIGVTWDVGHINMVKRFGFDDKDVVKETEAIAPYLKHIHLSDNFGLEHTELPMGMGNVPLKEMMAKLNKTEGQVKKIVEASAWWQHMKQSPLYESFQGLGVPLGSAGAAPYWNQSIGFQQGYFGGYGAMLPQQNYNMFGAGFSQLPQELGGQAAGGQGSRMSGRPME